MSQRAVGIFRTVFPIRSETFILEQARALSSFDPKFIVRDRLEDFEGDNIVSLSSSRIRRFAWTATRSPAFFPLAQLRGLSVVHAHFGQDGVMALPLAKALARPLITTFHGADITTDLAKFSSSRRPTERWFAAKEHELKRNGAGYIAVSRFIARKLLERHYPEEKIYQHYIGVDTEKFSPTSAPATEKYLLCVGRHTEKKGIDTLIKAWARVAEKFPDVMLVQVGGGTQTQNYKNLATELGVNERIRFTGPLPHRQILTLMRGALAFVLPSQTARDGDSEALGIVFNEASACGVPVISTTHGGIPEAVVHGDTGLLCEERDDRGLATHLCALLEDRNLAQLLGRRGREFVQDCFDLGKQTKKLENYYASFT